MAYNELFALAFVAPYLASGKRIPPQTIQEQGQGGKQKEHHEIYQMVHAGKRAAISDVLQGGFRRAAV